MKKFIHDFASGNIQIKYYLVQAEFSRKKRLFITILTLFVCLLLLGFSVKYYDHIGASAKWPIALFIILFLLLPGYIVGKRILRVKKNGKILFFNEHLEIHQNNEVRSLKYSEIIRIEYCGELPSDLLQNEVRSFKTYRVKFFTGIKEHFILHVYKDIFLLPEEKTHFKRIHPILPITLKEIKPRYGILEDTEF